MRSPPKIIDAVIIAKQVCFMFLRVDTRRNAGGISLPPYQTDIGKRNY